MGYAYLRQFRSLIVPKKKHLLMNVVPLNQGKSKRNERINLPLKSRLILDNFLKTDARHLRIKQ